MKRNTIIALLLVALAFLLWQAWKAGAYVKERLESPFRYFTWSEFDSPDAPGSGERYMKGSFVRTLDDIREAVGFPMFINSGYRTAAENADAGGVSDSAHMTGWAADIAAPTRAMKEAIAAEAIKRGIHRIGWGNTFIHLDADPDKDQYITWGYGNAYPNYSELALLAA